MLSHFPLVLSRALTFRVPKSQKKSPKTDPFLTIWSVSDRFQSDWLQIYINLTSICTGTLYFNTSICRLCSWMQSIQVTNYFWQRQVTAGYTSAFTGYILSIPWSSFILWQISLQQGSVGAIFKWEQPWATLWSFTNTIHVFYMYWVDYGTMNLKSKIQGSLYLALIQNLICWDRPASSMESKYHLVAS